MTVLTFKIFLSGSVGWRGRSRYMTQEEKLDFIIDWAAHPSESKALFPNDRFMLQGVRLVVLSTDSYMPQKIVKAKFFSI
jgi:hypothetical protein